jgi:PTS system galactitol-specific IIA component
VRVQFTFLDLLKPEHILVDMAARDACSAITILNSTLVQSANTLEEFAADACARELTFPTGLPTLPFAVAIPHADPDHVNSSAVAVGCLRSPVKFSQMGTDGSAQLDVHVVFLLAIKEREKQVGIIQQLMTVVQSQALLAALEKAGSPAEVMDLIRRALLS